MFLGTILELPLSITVLSKRPRLLRLQKLDKTRSKIATNLGALGLA